MLLHSVGKRPPQPAAVATPGRSSPAYVSDSSVVIGLVLGLFAAAAAADDRRSQPAWRKPAAAVLSADERSLAVANEGTGTISLLAAPAPAPEAWSQAQVVSESPVGKSLTDLAAIPGSDHFLATDAGADRVLLLCRQEDRFLELAALEVPTIPSAFL